MLSTDDFLTYLSTYLLTYVFTSFGKVSLGSPFFSGNFFHGCSLLRIGFKIRYTSKTFLLLYNRQSLNHNRMS